jgi:hypothetical protein
MAVIQLARRSMLAPSTAAPALIALTSLAALALLERPAAAGDPFAGTRALVAERMARADASTHLLHWADIRLRPLAHRVSAGLRLGYVTDLRRGSSPAALGSIHVRLPLLGERLTIGGEAGAWSRRSHEMSRGGRVNGSVRAVPVRGRLTVEEPVGPVALFAGVGLGVILARTQITSPGARVESRGALVPVAGAMAGLRVPLGPGRIGLEAGWWQTSLRHPEPASTIAGMEIYLGYELGF